MQSPCLSTRAGGGNDWISLNPQTWTSKSLPVWSAWSMMVAGYLQWSICQPSKQQATPKGPKHDPTAALSHRMLVPVWWMQSDYPHPVPWQSHGEFSVTRSSPEVDQVNWWVKDQGSSSWFDPFSGVSQLNSFLSACLVLLCLWLECHGGVKLPPIQKNMW